MSLYPKKHIGIAEKGTQQYSHQKDAEAVIDLENPGGTLFNGTLADVHCVSRCWGYVAKKPEEAGKLNALGRRGPTTSFT